MVDVANATAHPKITSKGVTLQTMKINIHVAHKL